MWCRRARRGFITIIIIIIIVIMNSIHNITITITTISISICTITYIYIYIYVYIHVYIYIYMWRLGASQPTGRPGQPARQSARQPARRQETVRRGRATTIILVALLDPRHTSSIRRKAEHGCLSRALLLPVGERVGDLQPASR